MAAAERALLIAVSPGEIWAALCVGSEPVELRLHREGQESRVGEIHLGRVVGLNPTLPAALVEIGLPRPALLSAEDAVPKQGIAGLREGEAIIVQVLKDARADKAAGVSLRLRLAGRLVDLLPRRPGISAARGVAEADRERLMAALAQEDAATEGLHLRAEATQASAAELAQDVAELRERWRRIAAASTRVRPPARLESPEPTVAILLAALAKLPLARILIDDRAAFAAARAWLQRRVPELADHLVLYNADEPLFEAEGIAAAVEEALAARIALPGGGAVLFEMAAAATLIDVDSGGAPILDTNLAAARAIARQIRLRSLAGPIVIDFIAMKRRAERDRVAAALTAALNEEATGAEPLGWTRLGHMELVRPRRHAPLHELIFARGARGGWVKTPLTVALEALRAAAREADATPGRALALAVDPAVAGCLRSGDAAPAREALESRLGRALTILAEPGRAREAFDIRAA